MTWKWTARLLALGGLALALGCRSRPAPPVIGTPLLPGEVINERPFEPVGPPKPVAPPLKPSIQPPAPFTRLPASNSSTLRLPDTGPDGPPKAVQGPPPRPVPEPGGAAQVKPLLVDPPKPPPGPDGFAPAPRLGLPDPPVATVPVPAEAPKPALPLKPGEKFGHAADYKWVAGVLDRHQKGAYWTLRYADSGEDDPWGGKVRLLADDLPAGFESGDVVYLEGELLAPQSAADNAAYPPFKVTDLRLVEKGR